MDERGPSGRIGKWLDLRCFLTVELGLTDGLDSVGLVGLGRWNREESGMTLKFLA